MKRKNKTNQPSPSPWVQYKPGTSPKDRQDDTPIINKNLTEGKSKTETKKKTTAIPYNLKEDKTERKRATRPFSKVSPRQIRGKYNRRPEEI